MGEDTVSIKKRIMGGILCLALLLSLIVPVCVQAADVVISEGAFDYKITEAGAEVTAYRTNGSSTVTVPSQVQGHPVTAIGAQVFRNIHGITAITIPEGVVTIGDRAFYACTDLSKIVLPDSLQQIGSMAFSNCFALETLQIPKNVHTIGVSAFLNCTAMKTLQVAADNASFKSVDNVLFSADMIVLISYLNSKTATSYTIPEQVRTIEEKAFLECANLQEVKLPTQLEEIGKYAFSACSALTEVTIPDSVTKIGNFAFNNCTQLRKAVVGTGVTKVPSYAFSGCAALADVTLQEPLQAIDMQAFAGCESLETIMLPDTLQTIGANAFDGSGVKRIILSEGLTQVGRGGLGAPELIFYRGSEAQKQTISFNAGDTENLDQAAWHYGVEDAVFAEQPCYYCEACDNYFHLNGSFVLATVTFLHQDGTVLSTTQYRYRDAVTEPETPTMEGNFVFAGWDKSVMPCAGNTTYTAVFEAKYMLGDTNGDEAVNNQDVVYLLWNVLFGDEYPIASEADFTKDGKVENDDVIYLLWYLLFGEEEYPLA